MNLPNSLAKILITLDADAEDTRKQASDYFLGLCNQYGVAATLSEDGRVVHLPLKRGSSDHGPTFEVLRVGCNRYATEFPGTPAAYVVQKISEQLTKAMGK